MEELLLKENKENKFKRFLITFWLKFYYVFCPMLLVPSFTILLEGLALKIYENTVKKIFFRNSLTNEK